MYPAQLMRKVLWNRQPYNRATTLAFECCRQVVHCPSARQREMPCQLCHLRESVVCRLQISTSLPRAVERKQRTGSVRLAIRIAPALGRPTEVHGSRGWPTERDRQFEWFLQGTRWFAMARLSWQSCSVFHTEMLCGPLPCEVHVEPTAAVSPR